MAGSTPTPTGGRNDDSVIIDVPVPRWKRVLQRPGHLLDRTLEALSGEFGWRKAVVIGSILFLYTLLGVRFLLPALRRFYIVAFHWKLEVSLFWSAATFYGFPILVAVILWIHKEKIWHVIVEALCLFGIIILGIGMWGMITKYPMVEDMGFFTAYATWINARADVILGVFALVVAVILRMRGEARFVPFFTRPQIIPVEDVDTIPRRSGRIKPR